ncbi:MAG: hypothetical protein JNK48_22490 [Bryobacterales bacterium]|nr:hypothetical protein [Bryobacterales bacterium]
MHRWLGCLLLALAACSEAPRKAAESKNAATAAKILNFYASPPSIEKGGDALLCYGVEGAAWVKLDPPVEQLAPALSRCFQVKPEATTQYTLSVEGASQKAEVTVTPAQPKQARKELIKYFVAAPREATAGEKVTLCYGVQDTKAVDIKPSSQQHQPADKICFTETVAQTTKFRLTAIGNDNSVQTVTLEVAVK